MESQYIKEISLVLHQLMLRGGRRTSPLSLPINPTGYLSISVKAQNSARYSLETMSRLFHKYEILYTEFLACS